MAVRKAMEKTTSGGNPAERLVGFSTLVTAATLLPVQGQGQEAAWEGKVRDGTYIEGGE